MAEHDTHERQELFLKIYKTGRWPNVNQACEAAGISRSTYYLWRENDPVFKKRADAAKPEAIENLEQVAFELAHEKDGPTIRFLLKSWLPERYGDKVEQTIRGGLNIEETRKTIWDKLNTIATRRAAPGVDTEPDSE